MAEARIVKEEMKAEKRKPAVETEPELKGTLASVLILGGIILISWLGVFLLYLIRN